MRLHDSHQIITVSLLVHYECKLMTKGICSLSIILLLLTVDLFPTIVIQDEDFIITKKKKKAPYRFFLATEDFLAFWKSTGIKNTINYG